MSKDVYALIIIVTAVVTFAVTVAIAIYGVRRFIERTVAEHLKRPDTIKQLASTLNPTLIIDHKGTVLYDRGGWILLDDLHVILEKQDPAHPNQHRHPEQIIIVPKEPMANEPLVSVIDRWEKRPVAHRGEGVRWIIDFESDGSSYMAWGNDNAKPPRFKLEFIQ
ncbi:MAG: hypothetical protein PVJ83_05955 [Gammaproteobacteria bacterium]|jgi:hypothetical protein